jgi:hypothetical protein
MMAEKEYIEREAALEAAKKSHLYFDLKPIINSIPAADVRPVVRGKWEYNPGDNIPYCSECMMPQDSECNFCPNCGAMMEES